MTAIEAENTLPTQERRGARMFDPDGGPDRILPPAPESELISEYHYDDEMLAELRKNAKLDIPESVDSLVLHMAGIWNGQKRMATNELDAQTEFAARSMMDLVQYLEDHGMRLNLMKRNRNYNVPAGELLVKPVPIESLTRKHRRLYVGDMLFREVCDAIAANDQIKVTRPNTGEMVYQTTFEAVDYKMTQDIHLNRSERAAKTSNVAPASGSLAVTQAFAGAF